MPLGDGKGRSGLQFGTPSSVSVGVTSTSVLTAANAALCEYISIVNDSDQIIYLAIGAAAQMNKGIRLNAGGGSIVFELPTIPTVAINAICASGSKNLCLQVAS